MATTTVSYYVDPTETPYVFGSVPLTDTQKLVCQIFGFGCLAILVIFMIGTFIYCTFIKPHKLRVAKRTAAAANGDVENQNKESGGRPSTPMREPSLYKSGAGWASDSTVDVADPPKAAMPGKEKVKKQKKPRVHNPETCRLW